MAALALCWSAAAAAAEPVDRWSPQISAAAARFALPAAWIRAVMAAESGGRLSWKGRPIVSRAGAMGLMQLMPGTWDEMRRRYRLGSDPFDPADNILAGAAYLREMYERFGYVGMIAAYNAGPGRYQEWLRSGRPLPAETRAYIAATTGRPATSAREVAPTVSPPPPPQMLFAVSRASSLQQDGNGAPADALFAVRRRGRDSVGTAR